MLAQLDQLSASCQTASEAAARMAKALRGAADGLGCEAAQLTATLIDGRQVQLMQPNLDRLRDILAAGVARTDTAALATGDVASSLEAATALLNQMLAQLHQHAERTAGHA